MAKKDVIYVAVIAILIISNIVNYNKLSSLENRIGPIDHLQNEFMNVHNSIQHISSDVDRKLEEFVKEQLWVPEKNYVVNDVDLKKDEINVSLEWRMRDIDNNEKVFLLFREEKESEWKRLAANHQNGLNYTVDHTFSLKGNYETQVIAISDESTRSEELLKLNFKEQVNNRMMIDAVINPLDQGTYLIHVHLQNSLEHKFIHANNINDYKIKKAKAFVYIGGEIVKEINLLKENNEYQSDDYNEYINYDNPLNLKEAVEELGDNIELHVVVEDGLGLKFEAKAIKLH